jgi:hypothetical protein
MPLTKVSFSVIQVANNVTSTTVGNTTSIPSFTFDQNGVITSASNTAISGAGITAHTVANSAFQTGSVERYLRGANLDFGMRNRIINGAMVIDQRNAGASVTASGALYTLDRWKCGSSQSSKYTVQQNAGSVTPPVGFSNYLGITSSSAYSIGSGDYFFQEQDIEGFNTADLQWGTANAKTVTLSFWVRSSLTGTFGGALQNSAADRSYPFSYTISAANTWEQKSITVAGDTTGTWVGATNGVGIRLYYGIGVGSTYSGTAGSWAATNYVSATGATSVVGTNGATFYITGVQLEVGTQATSFEYRQYGTELALCQRYFETNYLGVAPGTASYAGNLSSYTGSNTVATVQPYGAICFAVAKRALPTVTIYGFSGGSGKVSNYGGTDLAASSGAVGYFGVSGFTAWNNSGGSITTTNLTLQYNYTASSEL